MLTVADTLGRLRISFGWSEALCGSNRQPLTLGRGKFKSPLAH
jgi:hypothetical protein